MKLYRLYRNCKHEDGIERHLGLFKTFRGMLFFVPKDMRVRFPNWSDFKEEDVDVIISEGNKIHVRNINDVCDDYMYEIIDTDLLA